MTSDEYLAAMVELYGSSRCNKQMAELCGITHQMARRISTGLSEVSPQVDLLIKAALREATIKRILDHD